MADRKEYARQYRLKNREKIREKARLWQFNNREATREHVKSYRQRNPEKIRNEGATKRARKANAAPPWLTSEQLEEIAKIYSECPPGYHVDHIHPLCGRTICGLHVPSNLQYLTIEENLKKGNKLLETIRKY